MSPGQYLCYARRVTNTTIRTAIVDAVKRQPVAFAYLVGSYARHRETPHSDVDIAVYPNDQASAAPDAVSDIATRLQGTLKPLEVDVIDLRRAGIPVLRSVMKDASPILVNDTDKERRFRRSVFQRSLDFQPTLALIGKKTIEHIRQNESS